MLFLFASRLISAQTSYSHDASGNRINRLFSAPPLPVTLISFVAIKEGATAFLNWQTSSETNSDRFEVERGQYGKKWIFLGSVAAVGNKASRYSFLDKSPMDGENLYRLKMIDHDETFAYSRIQSLDFDFSLTNSVVVFYPNPVKDRLKIIEIDSGKRVNSKVQMYNSSGNLVQQSENIPTDGIDIRNLSAGIYIVRIINADGSDIIKKVIKE